MEETKGLLYFLKKPEVLAGILLLALMLLLALTLIISACKKQEPIANFEAQRYTIDERQGVPLTAITADENANPEKELTPEEKAALWQRKQEEEAKYRQWKDCRFRVANYSKITCAKGRGEGSYYGAHERTRRTNQR